MRAVQRRHETSESESPAFFLNVAVLSRKILVKAKYRIRTRYRHLLNIKGLGSALVLKKKPDQDIPGFVIVLALLASYPSFN